MLCSSTLSLVLLDGSSRRGEDCGDGWATCKALWRPIVFCEQNQNYVNVTHIYQIASLNMLNRKCEIKKKYLWKYFYRLFTESNWIMPLLTKSTGVLTVRVLTSPECSGAGQSAQCHSRNSNSPLTNWRLSVKRATESSIANAVLPTRASIAT